MQRVAIIGGGPGGLLTAFLIARKYGSECRTTVFEATGRLGGKLRTRTFSSASVPYESGAAELYDYSIVAEDPFRRLIDELGVRTRPMSGHTVVLAGAVLQGDDDIARVMGKPALRALRDFRQRAEQLMPIDRWHPDDWEFAARHPWARRSYAELLETIRDPLARRYITVATHSDLATEPHLTDGLTGLKNVVMDIPGYVRCHSVEGGMSRLADSLIRRIDSDVHLSTRVLCIERTSAESWRISSVRNGRMHTDDFAAVFIALPVLQLGALEFSGKPLRSAIAAHLARFDRPGHYLRVSLLFRSPFWKNRLSGSWFMVDAFGGACVYDESARYDTHGYGVLGYLIAGNAALHLANMDDVTLARRALEALPSDLRARAAANFLEVKVHRWCGAVSAQPGGNPVCEPGTMHALDDDRLRGLLLVGDYCFDSTLNGAYQSADLATTLLPNHLPLSAGVAA